jgi:hypothetical protein
MLRLRNFPFFAIAILALVSVGCVKRVPLTPAQTVTLNLNQTLAAIATVNQAVASDVIGVNKSGLIQGPLTNSILNYSRLVAQAVLTAENVQQGALSDADKAAAIKSALAVLKLPQDVAALVSGPQGDAAIAGLVSTITSLQSLIGAIGGGK